MNLYDLENGKPSRKKIAEAGYGQNRGYAQGFASPTAPSLGQQGRAEDEVKSEFDDKMRKLTGMIFYNVNDPEMASALGLKQTRTGKWFLRTGNRNAQQAADREFGQGKVWYPKNESADGISKEKETEFHSQLDTLVHDTFGKRMDEGEEMGTFAALKDWQVWDVHVFNNFYRGKYADYGPRLYSVVASSPEEARQVVINNPDYVLQDLLSRKLQNGKKVLPRGSALPVEEKRVGKAQPGTITTMALKKMLTPDGVQSFKFTNGKIVDGSHVAGGEQVEEASFDYTMKDMGNDYAGFPSNHSMKHKFLAKIKPEKQQLYKDKINNTHEWDDLFALFNVAKHRGDIIEQGVAEGQGSVSVRQWANQVRRDHGSDVKFRNRQEGGGAVDSVIAKNSNGETVGVYNRKTGYPTVYEPKQGVAEGQLNEYLVKAGMPVQDVLALNLFQDFDPVEGAAAQFPEFAEEPMWQQVVRKYAPIANMLKKKLLATKRPLTDAEAEAVEQTWYDGSDAYDDMEIEYLIDIYDQQIDTLEALLAGNLTDEEFGEARANTAGTRAGLARRANAVPLSPEEQAAKDKAKSDKWLEKERAKMAAKKGVAESDFNHKPDNWSQDFERRMSTDNNGFDTHIVMVTVSDPNATAVTQRGETVQKRARVRANDRETAINMAINHYKKAGYRVQDHHYVGAVRSGATPRNEDSGLNELSNDLLGRYKKELGIRASAADKAGDYEKGNEYFKKINRATIRQGDNDARRHEQENQNEMMETRLNMMRKAGYDL